MKRATEFLKSAITSSLDAFKEYERLEVTINIATQGQGEQAMQFLNKMADRYRYQIGDLADSYKGFAAAATAAGYSLQETNFIYESLVASGRALSLSNEQLSGTFLAVQQMISKGKISAEELNQQLGERFPGAQAVMAKSLGMTTEEMLALMKQGKLTDRALLDFARTAREEYGSKVPEALKTTAAAGDRLANELFKLKRDFGEAINPFNIALIEAGGDILEQISRDAFEELNEQAERFKGYLEKNPEIVENLSAEISKLLRDGLNYVADKTKEFLDYLKENPDAIQQAIDKMGNFLEQLGQAAAKVLDLADNVLLVAENIAIAADAATRLGGAAATGTEYFAQNAGISPQRIQQIEDEVWRQIQGEFSYVLRMPEAHARNIPEVRQRFNQLFEQRIQDEVVANSSTLGSSAITYRTNTVNGQDYGDPRNGGRTHAGQDFDISGPDAEAVTFTGGVVTMQGYDPAGYGHYIDIWNEALGVVERIAEVGEVLVDVGDTVAPGTVVGRGETDTGVFHYEVRQPEGSSPYGRVGGFGYEGTLDPLEFYRSQGLAAVTYEGGEEVSVIPRVPAPRSSYNALATAGNLADTAQSANQIGRIPQGGVLADAERVQSDTPGAQAIVAAAMELGLDPVQLGALMSFESGGTLNPNVLGGDGNLYKGLIQFSPHNQDAYGTSTQQSIAQQMPAVVEYLRDAGFVPGQHDIRNAYAAVLTGDPNNMTARDSNGTSVENAHHYFTSGDHYNRAAQFLSNSGVSLDGFVAGDPGTPGYVPIVDPEDEAQRLEAIRRELQSLQNQELAAHRQLEDAAIEQQREARDIQLESLEAQFSQNEALRTTIGLLGDRNQVNDKYADQLREYDRTIADLQQKNQDLRDTPLESEENAAARDEVIAANEALIQQYQAQRAQIESLRDTELDSLYKRASAVIELAEEQRELEMATYRAQQAVTSTQLQAQLAIAQLSMENAHEASLLSIDTAVENIRAQAEAGVLEFNQQREVLIKAREEFLTSLGSLTPEEVESLGGFNAQQLGLLDNQIANLDEKIEDSLSNSNAQIEIQLVERERLLREHTRAVEAELNQTGDALADLQLNRVEQASGVWVANPERRAEAERRILRDLELQIEQYREAGLLTDELEVNLRGIAEMEIASLADQFQTLGDTVDDILNGSFKDFFRSVISGNQSLLESFTNLVSGIAAQLAELAVNQIWTDLFGAGLNLFGGESATSSAGAGLVETASAGLGAVLGIASNIPMFANGGLVDRPTLAMIGEGAYSEAVVPLPDGRSIPVQMRGSVSGESGDRVNSIVNVTALLHK